MADLSMYLPMTVEDELTKLVNFEGRYVPNFTSEDASRADTVPVQNSTGASFVFDNSFFGEAYSTKVSGTVFDDYDNIFYYRQPGDFTYSGNRWWINKKSHPVDDRLFRKMPFHSTLAVPTLPAPGRVLDLHVIVLSSNWIRVSGSRIVEVSPSIKASLDAWKSKNKRNPTNLEYFGVQPFGFEVDGNGTYSSTSYEVDLVSNTVIGTPNTSILVLGVKDSAIANPTVARTPHLGNYLVKDRGLTSYNAATPKPVVTLATAKIAEVNQRFIRGTSNKTNWYVTIWLENLGLKATVQTNPFDGSWVYTYSSDEKAFLEESQIEMNTYKNQIKVLIHEKPDPGYSAEEEKATDPDVIKVQGAERYVMYSGGRFVHRVSTDAGNYVSLTHGSNTFCFAFQTSLWKYDQEFYKDKSSSTVPLLDGLKRTSAVQEDLNKIYLGYYVGMDKTTLPGYTVGFPGSVITSCGIDLFYKVSERSYSEPNRNSTELFPRDFKSSFKHAITFIMGATPASSEEQNYNLRWNRESFLAEYSRYKLRWSRNRPADQDVYSLKWNTNYEPRDYTDSYRLRWARVGFLQAQDQYLVRWEKELPAQDEDRFFYDFSWQREFTQDETAVFRFRYSKEMSKQRVDNYALSWSKPKLDDVILKLFYVNEAGRHHISYMVYGAPSVQAYIQDDTLLFYFSNPSKYELIKFNRNSEPYSGVFMKEIKHFELEDNREGIPEDYILIGNYTIMDIDIKNSLSLDVVAEGRQLNEYRSYWLPDDLSELDPLMRNVGPRMKAAPLIPIYKEDHHVDVVDLELEFVNETECCFTQKSVGTRCSPY